MSGFITNTGENFLLDLICRAVRPPETLWIALIANKEPTKFTVGLELDEPQVSEYERIPYPNSSGNWSARSGEMSNLLAVESAVLSGNEEWPTIRHWGVLNSEQGGDLLWAGSFISPLRLTEGDQVTLPAGSLTLRTAAYSSRVSVI